METMRRVHVGSPGSPSHRELWTALNESADPLEGHLETCPALVTDAELKWLHSLPGWSAGYDWGTEMEPDAEEHARADHRRSVREHCGTVLAGDVPTVAFAAGVAYARDNPDPSDAQVNAAMLAHVAPDAPSMAAAMSADLFMRGYLDARAVQRIRDSAHATYVNSLLT